MGKRDTKDALSDSKTIQSEAKTDYGEQIGSSEDRADQPIAPFNPATDNYTGDTTGGDWTGGSAIEGKSSNINDIRGLYGGIGSPGEGSTGAGDQRDFLNTGYRDIYSNTARLKDPRAINTGELKDTLGGYKSFRDTGGLSDENVNRMRGGGGYDEFAKTGGYTPESIANIKAQALSPIGSYATGTQDELARRGAVQGGYTPGFDAASRQLRRDTARAIADTSLNANVGIQDRINAGRQWGIGGMSNTENALGNLQTGNRLGALGGESSIGNSLSGYDAQDIANSQNTDQFNIQNKQNQQQAGLGGLGNLYEGTMGRQENAFGRELTAQQNALGRGFQGSQNALDRNLTTSENFLNRGFSGNQNDLNRQQAEYDRQAQLLGGRYNTQLGGLNNQSQIAMQPGIGGNIMGAIGAGAGIGAGFFNPVNGGYRFGNQVANVGNI